MAIRTIVKHPDAILREKAMVVTKFNSRWILEIRPPTSLCNSRATARVTTPSKATNSHLNLKKNTSKTERKIGIVASHSVAQSISRRNLVVRMLLRLTLPRLVSYN